MFICDNLVHPFQNDPGTSQRQRVMADLLSGPAKIDGRNMADLLDYFVQLSRHINYYNTDLSISDWQPFFQKSIPFSLAAIIKYNRTVVTAKTDAYAMLFDKRPSKAGLQLLFHYFFQQVINPVNTWHLQLKGSGLPAELIIEKLIKDKLSEPLKKFICYNSAAVKWYCVKPVDFRRLAENDVWNLDITGLLANADECKPKGKSKRKRLIAFRNNVSDLLPAFLEAIRIISDTAAQSMEQSLFPLKEELQKQHTPHLALLFAFLKLFEHLQGDLNKYTKKHLDFFYKQVLKLKPREAVPDKAHIVFEIQKQLDKYLLKKGLLVKDGKDANKSEILFALEDEIVVNKTQVADKRTLFLNNQDAFEHTYLEGVYMAPNASKADGLTKDFKDTDPKSFPTLGAKLSKYTHPEKTLAQPYPNARIGFIMASPVLLLNEGKRTIDITLACQLKNDYCNEEQPVETGASGNCCEDPKPGQTVPPVKAEKKYPDFIDSPGFYKSIVNALNEIYYYISEDIIVEAVKKGISKDLEKGLRGFLIEVQTKHNSKEICYCPAEIEKYDAVLNKDEWLFFFNAASGPEKIILNELIKPRKLLRVYFSGEKEWIEPVAPSTITASPALILSGTEKHFLLKIKAVLEADQPAVTFYDKKNLKEDFGTTQPLVKIELDDKIKSLITDEELINIIKQEGAGIDNDVCCLLTDKGTSVREYFCITNDFIADAIGISAAAAVYLNGLLTAQNNFRKIIFRASLDYFLSVKNPAGISVFTPADKIVIKGLIDNPPKNYCSGGLHAISSYHFFRNVIVVDEVNAEKTKIDVSVCGLKNFIVQNEDSLQDVNGPVYPFGTRPEIIDFDVVNPAKPPLTNPNLIGPNFYIGSKEVFCKKWNEVFINLNWKDKPASFNEYYKGYVVRSNYHDCVNMGDNTKKIYGLNECDFQINLAVLENGIWIREKDNSPHTSLNPITGDNNRKLFASDVQSPLCVTGNPYEQTIRIFHNEVVPDPQFNLTQSFNISNETFPPYNVSSRNGFLRINLQGQDFLHKDYSYVLARQMMAFGRYPDLVNGAVYIQGGIPQVFDISIFFGNIGPKIIEIASDVVNSAINGILNDLIQIITDKIDDSVNQPFLNGLVDSAKGLLSDIALIAAVNISDFFLNPFDVNSLTGPQQTQVNTLVKDFVEDLFDLLNTNLSGIEDELKSVIRDKFNDILDTIDTTGIFTGLFGEKEVVIPNEPWTPIIKNISLDYTATAENTDIDFIHLYPYEGTYKKEEITLEPSLFPVFCDEGSLFIGLKDLVPGSNLNMLFQLAEATADSESDKEEVNWHYLDNNQWKTLRNGFEVLDDATDGLTTSGIVKFALPENMTSDNTILPKGLHWVKASIPKNSKAVSETIGIYTQAIRAVFTNEATNDKLRLGKPLEAGAISKLNEADTSIKKLVQPFDSFGGRQPEAEGHFYVRVSELLRHKGRAIQKFDYERIALEAFPQLFKVKCINHSFALNAYKYKNDFPIAPGYVLLAVIPDLNQLKAAQSFEPRVPVSMLDDIQEQMRKLTSPFVRFRAMNPRYEKIHFCLKVKLIQGKDENYYKEQLKQDLREFMAPWAVGKYDKLTFGQCVSRSEIVRFLEMLDYVDYIIELVMRHNDDAWPNKANEDELAKPICPKTPRSILIAGNIDVCIPEKDCEEWAKCRNAQGQEEDCCKNPIIPITEYCINDIIG